MKYAVTLLVVLACITSSLAMAVREPPQPNKEEVIEKEVNVEEVTPKEVILEEEEKQEQEMAPRQEETTVEPSRNARIIDLAVLSPESNTVKLMVSLVRNLIGIPRGQTSRNTRQILGAVAGRNGCWQRMLCQAGRVLAIFGNTEPLFGLAERMTPEILTNSLHIVRRSALEGDDCSEYHCDV